MVDDLGLEVDSISPKTTVKVANSALMSSLGTVKLTFKRIGGRCSYSEIFEVFETDDFDVILGWNFLQKGLKDFNIDFLVPLIESHRESQRNFSPFRDVFGVEC